MRKEFGFVGGDVDAYRAVTLAAFAGEAEVEGLFHFFAAPAIANDCVFSRWSLRHLPEQVSAAAGGVFFFVRDAVAGAHDAPVFAAAFANAHAAQRGGGKAAVIGGKLESGLRFPGCVVGAEAKIFVELVGRFLRQTNELAGIHLPVGIPCGLEFAKGLH